MSCECGSEAERSLDETVDVTIVDYSSVLYSVDIDSRFIIHCHLFYYSPKTCHQVKSLLVLLLANTHSLLQASESITKRALTTTLLFTFPVAIRLLVVRVCARSTSSMRLNLCGWLHSFHQLDVVPVNI